VTDAQLRFGLIGTGYWAREVHAAGIAVHPGARLVGVWGRDRAKTAALASSYDATPFDDLDAMLETVDAVAFAVPPDIQAALTPQVVAAGCHVLFEKPLAISLAAADTVLDAVQAAGVASVVFFTERFVPERKPGYKGWVNASGGGPLAGLAADPNNPFADSPWRKVEGALWDVGPHALAAVLPVLGPVRDIVGATGYGDLVHLVLTHESRATSTVHLSLTMPPPPRGPGSISTAPMAGTPGRTRHWTPSRRTATRSASSSPLFALAAPTIAATPASAAMSSRCSTAPRGCSAADQSAIQDRVASEDALLTCTPVSDSVHRSAPMTIARLIPACCSLCGCVIVPER